MNSLESNIKCEKELYFNNNLSIKGNLKINNNLDEKYSILNSNYLQLPILCGLPNNLTNYSAGYICFCKVNNENHLFCYNGRKWIQLS